MIGILEHIDGRKLKVGDATVYLRKGVDSAQYLPLLQSDVLVETVEEKGFQMVQHIAPVSMQVSKPSLPKTAVEDTKPVDMPSSANVPKLKFGDSSSFTSVVGGETAPVAKIVYKPDTKQKAITASWAMGATLNSLALAQCNDAMALSTQQTVERAKHIAEELIKWVEEQAVK